MQLQQGNMLAALEDAKTFLGVNVADVGDAVNDATKKLLDDSIGELSAHAADQNAHTRAGAGALNRQRLQREALIRDHMAPIAKIAILELPNVPDIIKLTLPKSRVSLQQLLVLADGMANAATPYAATFIAAGCKTDFIASLKTAVQDIRTAATDRTTIRMSTQMSRCRGCAHCYFRSNEATQWTLGRYYLPSLCQPSMTSVGHGSALLFLLAMALRRPDRVAAGEF